MKSFLDFAKQKENDELKRQVDHLKDMTAEHEEKAQSALMMGDRDGHALHMAKCNHFKTQHDELKSKMSEEVETKQVKKPKKKPVYDIFYPGIAPNERYVMNQIAKEKAEKAAALKNKKMKKEEVDLDESHVAIAMGKELDDEGSMIMNQLDQIERSIKMMRDIVKDPEMQIPAWVQSKVTLAADYMETVAGYMSSKNEKVSEEVDLDEASPAWQRKEGKNPSGGLNAKGVASYRRANPGSKLKTAVTTKPSKLKPGSKAANRRKSFCARMSGMKKRLTSAKTAKDPNSRINKSLRKWNC